MKRAPKPSGPDPLDEDDDEEMDEMLKREIHRLNGMFYGSLSEDEREIVEEAIRLGLAKRVWVGAAGFLGLSKVVAL